MKKKLIFILGIVILCSLAGLFFLNHPQQKEKTPFKIAVNSKELLTESKEKYNSVQVYQQDHQLVVDAKSESEFFDDKQFTVQTQGALQPSDVKIKWTTLDGGTQATAENERILAKIEIRENGKLIFEKKINFLEKAFHSIEKGIEKNKKQ